MNDEKLKVVISLKDDMTNRLKRVEKEFKGLEDQSQKVKLGLLAVGAGAAFAIKNFVELASDAEETQSKFNTVFSGIENDVNSWAETFANDIGRARQDIKAFTAGIADVLKPMGLQTSAAAEMSKQMVELALDVASFNNRQDADVIHAFTSALTGERESLKTLGVVINEVDVKQEAYRAGLTKVGEALSKEAKAQATVNLLFANTKDAQGDLIRTSGSFANRLKALKAKTSDLGEEIGQKLLPIATKLIEKLSDIVEKLKPMAEWIDINKDSLISLSIIIGGTGGTIFLIKQFTDVVKILSASLKSLAIITGVNTVGITGLKLALLGLPAAITIAVVLAGFTLVMNQIIRLKREIKEQVKSENTLYDMRMQAIRKYMELKKSEDKDVRAYAQANLEHLNNLRRVQDENAEIDLGQSRRKIQDIRNILSEKDKLVLIETKVADSLALAGDAAEDFGAKGGASAKKVKDEFEELTKEIEKIGGEIESILSNINQVETDQAKSLLEYKEAMAEAYVKQEEKVSELIIELSKKEKEYKEALIEKISGGELKAHNDKLSRIKNEQQKIEEQLKAEQSALDGKKTIEIAFSNEVSSVREFNALSDFEQTLYLLNKKKIEEDAAHTYKLEGLNAELEAKQKQVEDLSKEEVKLTEVAIKEQGTRTNNFITEANKEIKKAEEVYSAKARAYSFNVSGVNFAPLSPFSTGSLNVGGSTIPMLANGGIVTKPTLAMIGEKGPEAIIPLSKKLSKGNNNISLIINNPVFRNNEDERRLKQQLDKYFRPLMINHKISY